LTIPDPLLATVAFTLSLGPISTIVLWGMMWMRLEHSMRTIPTLRLGQKLAQTDPPRGRVCVIVPAHNEARVIAGLIESLRAETHRQLRVVLALDRCTDDTAALARAAIGGDERFEIVEIGSCPPEWAGKVHAVHMGVTRSRAAADADYLLFADADTLFSPGCIASSLALMRERKLDLLSLLSTLIQRTWFERVVQMAAAFELVRQYPLTLANAAGTRRPFANGQFMLFRRRPYEAVGGHAAVKNALLEDLALARLISAGGRSAGVFLAAGLFRCRMYADWPQFRRGWKRIYIEAANHKPRRLAQFAWRVRWLDTFVPIWMLAAGPGGALLVPHDPRLGWAVLALWFVALPLWVGCLLRMCAVSDAPAWTAPLHPIGAWLTANLLGEAAGDLRSQRPTKWGGREYGGTSGSDSRFTPDASKLARPSGTVESDAVLSESKAPPLQATRG
jgi:cellulose synthase/poly-beta-1,6-N-acetylglucosamine synthase-like glycosyltransferase